MSELTACDPEARNEEYIREASNLIQKGDAVFFIGAGMVKGFFPDWEELMDKMLDFFKCNSPSRLDENELKSLNEYKAAEKPLEYFEVLKKKNAKLYLGCLEKIFGQRNYSHRHGIAYLLRSKCSKFITTNYDSTIERACSVSLNPMDYKSTYYPESYLFTNFAGKEIIHIHGLIGNRRDIRVDDIVLHQSSYEMAYTKHGRILTNLWRHLIGTHNLIFIGTSFSERIIRRVFEIAKDKSIGKSTNRFLLAAYSDNRDNDKKDDDVKLSDYRVKTIRFDKKSESFDGLDDMLGRLTDIPQVNLPESFGVSNEDL